MNWALGILLFFAGTGVGYLLHWRFKGNGDDSQQLRRELEQARFDLDQQRQEVADYFEQSRELMMQLGQSLDKANKFWNESAQGMLGDGQVMPITPSQPQLEGLEEFPPKDYVQGSHGIIGNQEKAANS
ncbi:YhcB family protein [Ferrimonas balearica]|uniref:YhcB family protein n=1 Tax=Ferrimonas balearica TaxID=44012 RepID=UPI001C998D43|nr:DUF1043 family protein [Ferrimonas balearica]MBY5993085.1 YhcB family protein [Ferrimonas balearica]